MAGRPKKELPLPEGLRRGMPVKVTGAEFKGIKLGLIADVCKADGGILVWLTGDSSPEKSVYTCIQPERGDTIGSVEDESTRVR